MNVSKTLKKCLIVFIRSSIIPGMDIAPEGRACLELYEAHQRELYAALLSAKTPTLTESMLLDWPSPFQEKFLNEIGLRPLEPSLENTRPTSDSHFLVMVHWRDGPKTAYFSGTRSQVAGQVNHFLMTGTNGPTLHAK